MGTVLYYISELRQAGMVEKPLSQRVTFCLSRAI